MNELNEIIREKAVDKDNNEPKEKRVDALYVNRLLQIFHRLFKNEGDTEELLLAEKENKIRNKIALRVLELIEKEVFKND